MAILKELLPNTLPIARSEAPSLSAAIDAVARAIAASGTPEAPAAEDALEERLRLQGIAIDRILGLPDGSIAFVEPGFARVVIAARGSG